MYEYESSGEMDLSLLLEMPDNQQITVRQFFANQIELAEPESKISEEDREDLTAALVEVFIEKGIVPTPTQDLILIGLKVFGIMGIKAFAIQKQNEAVLAQLRENAPDIEEEEPPEEQETPTEEEPISFPSNSQKPKRRRAERYDEPTEQEKIDDNLVHSLISAEE